VFACEHHIKRLPGERNKDLGVFCVVFHPTYLVRALCKAYKVESVVVVRFEFGGIWDADFTSIKVDLVTRRAVRLVYNPPIAAEALDGCQNRGQDVVPSCNLRQYRHFLVS
jgi:hypothetical protein